MQTCPNCKLKGEPKLQDKCDHYVQYWQSRWWHIKPIQESGSGPKYNGWTIEYEKICDCGCEYPVGAKLHE